MRWLPVAVTAGLAACAFPAVAGATDYCVEASVACGPKNVGSFQEALGKSAANADADRIFLGAEKYIAPDASGFKYQNLAGPVQIIGSGQDDPSGTVITGPDATAGHVLSLMGGPGTSIEDVRIELPSNLASGMSGLKTNGTARRILVVENSPQPNPRYGVALAGGVLEGSIVFLTPTTGAAVFLDYGGGTVRESSVHGYYGIISYGGSIERSGVAAESAGILAYGDPTTVSSSEISVAGAVGTGIGALVAAGSDTKVVADGVNILGPDAPNATAVRASTALAPLSSVSVTLRNSLVRGFGTTLQAQSAAGGSGSAQIAASYSDYEPGKTVSSASNATIAEMNISNVGEVGFEVAEGSRYHLLPSSPLVDAGDPATPQGLDVTNRPLVTDGNLDGTARRDIGAYELPGPLPGEQSGAGDRGGGAGSGSGDAGAADRQAPVLSRFSASTARRTRFRYTLNESARVTITVQRVVRSGGRVSYRTVGRLTRTAAQGANRTRLLRKIGRHVLRAGRYRAIARATDAAGNRSVARRAAFRIVAR